MIWETLYESPIGSILLKASAIGITEIAFAERSDIISNTNTHLESACEQLEEYFSDKRKLFDLSLDIQGTDFQQSVWKCLREIPFGISVSYQDISNTLNNPKAVRAVGTANGSNKIAIVIPCHRVIGSDGSLTGYAYGVDKKEWLLRHEGHSTYRNNQLKLF